MEEISPVAYIASVAAASSFKDLPAFAALRPAMDAWFQPEASSSDQPWEGAAELRDCLLAFHERMDEARRSHPNIVSQLSSDPSLLPRSVDQLPAARPKLQQRLSRLIHTVNKFSLWDSAGDLLKVRLLANEQEGTILLCR